MATKTYNVGIYCRLSNDDERDGESVSIENQKLLLQNYVRQRGWNEIDTYIDDGYSGTNFDRPGVKRLIEDAKAKRINVILVKDLSRFGRNYIEFGQYTDYLFPSLGCRFIALNNGIDTESTNGSTDVMCFLNLFNEFYSRDTSKKVKAVKKACAENGKFMGTYPAYGYKRDPADKHHLVIDEDTAPIVRRIFEMRAAGTGFHAIAVMLNEEGIPSPGVLYYQRKGQSDPRRVNHKWADQTVKNIVRSEVYIGNMVQGKTGTLSYKSRKLVGKPEEEWIRVEGTHEPIISQELWDTVVSIDKKKVRKSSSADGYRSIFTGLVYCADCGFKMRNQVERFTYKDGTPGRYSSFICGNYSRSGKGACTIHTIYENVLSQLVLEDIREKARFAEYDPEQLVQQIIRLKDKEAKSRLSSCEQELKTYMARLSELERLMQNLYEDKCAGTIPQTVFQTLMHKYEAERAEKAEAIPELERKVKSYLENRTDANRWLAIIRRYTEITELDESMHYTRRRICTMAIYHCSIKIIGRSDGKSAVASSAYRSGEKLMDDRTGLIHDFTKKRGVVFTEVSLTAHAPPEYADRNVLWNAVEKAEKKSNAQLAREIEVALPKELSRECQIEIVRRYVQNNFVSVGMCADWALHDKGDGNPHAHIMLTVRGMKPDGTWAQKEKKDYALDEEGNRIPLIDPATGKQKLGKRNEKMWKRITVEANDWNDHSKAEIWRKSWADICNEYLSVEQQIDHRSYKRQELDLEPTIHEGYRARKMEKAGFVSNRCEYNRIVRKLNELKGRWLLTIQELQKTIMEKGRMLYERIRKLMERRQSFEIVGGLTGGERAVSLTAGTKGESDTDAFIRCAKAEITDMLHAIDDSRTRARDSEVERSKHIQRSPDKDRGR